MAIVLVIFGFMSASAMQVYTLYKKGEIVDQNNISLLRAKQAVGDFREMYGRYPCPARMDAIRGNVDYGYESRNAGTGNCQAVAGGVLTATSNNGALPNQDVFIGILPFRQLNLPEKLVSDGYKNRISYAVTGLLANDTTYNDIWGGVTIIDFNNNSATNPPNSAHFIVLSYNQNDGGAITQNGMITTPCPVATPETENCDNDSTFRVGLRQNDFDDLIEYSVSDNIQQWQLSNTNDEDIHLRKADSIAMGINETDSTAGFNEAEFLNAAEPAIIRAEEDAANSFKGQLFTNNICDESGTNCFPSSAIAGQIASAEGMDCGAGFLIGIANGVPICENEITFSCPAGTFISGFDAAGKLVCDTQPPIKCLDNTLTTTCGDTRNVTAFFNGGTWYGYAYSGQYYTIDPLNIPSITAATSLTDVQTYITTLNNTPRVSIDAGPSKANAMVRNTFQCSAGSWIASPIRALERIANSSDLSTFSPLYNTPYWPAETGSVAFNPATPMSVDPANSDWGHDCWCREDYRVKTKSCGVGLTGNEFRIEKHTCPQTGNNPWTVVYAYDDTFCVCNPNIYDDTATTCKSHFSYSGIGVKGNIKKTYQTTCPGPVTTLINTSTDDCECPAQPSPLHTTEACPFGTSNSFTYMGTPYTNKSKVNEQNWICPSGVAPVKPITSALEAGYYTTKVTVHTEPCVCNSSLTKPHHENCAAGEQGTGKDYLLPWNCIAGTFDAPSPANIITDDCHSCIWQAGTKRSGGPHGTGGTVKRGDPCPSCTGTKTCHTQVSSGPNLYDVWDACYCAGQP